MIKNLNSKWSFKKILKEIIIALLLLFVISNVINYLRKPIVDSDLLPSFKASTLLGKKINTKSYNGKPLLIHFWATWCPICRLENANIEDISKEYNVITIAVKSGSDEALQKYMNANSLSFDVINDREGIFSEQFHVEAFPTTFIYGPDSRLKFSEVGYSTTAGLLARLSLIREERKGQ